MLELVGNINTLRKPDFFVIRTKGHFFRILLQVQVPGGRQEE